MPKYWVKNYFAHGSFPEVGQKQKTERKEEEERLNDGDNNGQATHGARKHAWRTQAAWAKILQTKPLHPLDSANIKVILLCQLCKSPVKKLKKIRKKLSIETHSSKFTTPSYTYFNSNLFKSKHAQHDCLRFG